MRRWLYRTWIYFAASVNGPVNPALNCQDRLTVGDSSHSFSQVKMSLLLRVEMN